MVKKIFVNARVYIILLILCFILICQSSIDHVEARTTPDTIVWMSDTQYYAKEYPDIFMNMTDWIKKNEDNQQIKYVVHTGDIVDQYTEKNQWKISHKAFKKLDHAKIPYGVLAGNHDVGHNRVDYSKFTHYFGDDRFSSKESFAGSYENNRNHYDTFSAGGRDFLMLYLGWGINKKDINWAKNVLEANPNKTVFLNVHDYLHANGKRSTQGNMLFQELVTAFPSIKVVLCGHYHGAAKAVDLLDDDGDGKAERAVYQMLADYQSAPSGGQGFMRLLTLDSQSNEMTVQTYSPYLDQYNYYPESTHPGKDSFTIQLPQQQRPGRPPSS
ncbi:metallophosphoesterase [Alkalicoccobacillus porphyridii]|uniref:Calcineurin-like phosphoesterase domain-containing protein n=1 Tax=Alkalicoccobacillus porphyridii TaxID=2597270 RepID=A0A553ZT78_9BACI|nr:metallophosphoesterase [Alkalicoccobacillus porphyridii]TSB44677.1 hypothetical protein FN960_20180 [Alkalicoccobacillus porphyridii]